MSRELVHQLFGYIEVSETSFGEGAFIAEIGPELAQTLLHLNFKQNKSREASEAFLEHTENKMADDERE